MRTRAVTVLLMAMAGGGASIAMAAAGDPAIHTRAAERNHRAARRDARQLLGKIELPVGAVVTSHNPAASNGFADPQISIGAAAVIDDHRFWLLAGEQPHAVLRWFQAHVPAGSSQDVSGTATGPGYEIDSLAFRFRPVPGSITARVLVVSVTAARRGGTAVRVDAEEAWFIPRPKSERVPAGVRVIEVVDRKFNPRTGTESTSSRTVTDPAAVGKMVAEVNALPPGQPGVRPCPVDVGPNVALRFFGVLNGPAVAEADADGSGCGEVGFKLGRKIEPYLTNGPGLVAQLDTLLGTHL